MRQLRITSGVLFVTGALILGAIPSPASAAEEVRKAPFEYLIFKVRVGDLQKSLDFYATFFGYKEVLRTKPSPTGAVQVYLTRGGENFRDGLTLVHDPANPPPADRGALHTIVFSVRDIMGTVKRLEGAGHKITRPPTSTGNYPSPLTSSAVIGYTVDPNGYPVEMVEWKP